MLHARLGLQVLFGLTLFLGAALLFWVQLVVSKLLLPVLGGSSAVWNTCLVFFQGALLGGYLYAHLAARWRAPLLQPVSHVALLALAGLTLPFALGAGNLPPTDANPIPWLLGTLSLMVGPSFLVLAATAPMLQSWFARSGAPGARDPYFLYAASNLGSLLSLLTYPTVIEPRLHLGTQIAAWAFGYALLVVLTALCAAAAHRRTAPKEATPPAVDEPARDSWRMRARWVLLAFVPSSLLLGVTTHLTTDIAAAPLFWVVPLALYLLSFVLAFQRVFPLPIVLALRLQPFLIVPLAVIFLWGVTDEPLVIFPLHLAAFFVTALLCHQLLASLRPPPARLTGYYLLISLGGALGGAFNALLAPVLFDRVAEYPLALVLACLMRPGTLPSRAQGRAALGDIIGPALLLLLAAAVPALSGSDFAGLGDSRTLVVVAFLILIAYSFRERPVRFGLGVGAILVAGLLAGVIAPGAEQVLLRTRNFYGVLAVADQEVPPTRVLYHGTTTHGQQSRDPARRLQPLSYYHPDGPLGQLFEAVADSGLTQRVAAIGLGAGSIACYGQEGEDWTFYEINPAVVAIAENPELFTFLADCPVKPEIVLGDARLSLARAADGSFGLIILDAFNSDAIPVHLITREAIALYLAKLKPGGLLVFHISNRYLNLRPVLGNAAQALGLAARAWFDEDETADDDPEITDEKDASDWVVVARRPADLAPIADDERWQDVATDPRLGVWSDDYSNLLGTLAH